MLVGLGGKVLEVAQCITTLIVRGTGTTTEQGKEFLQAFANSDVVSAEHVDFSGDIDEEGEEYPSEWFDDSECLELLLTAVAKQPHLKCLKLIACELTEEE